MILDASKRRLIVLLIFLVKCLKNNIVIIRYLDKVELNNTYFIDLFRRFRSCSLLTKRNDIKSVCTLSLSASHFVLKKTRSEKSHGYRDAIGFKTFRFQNVSRPRQNAKLAL